MRAVFVDTSGWLALILQNDQYHEKAAAYHRKLQLQRMPLITSDYVLDETYTRLRYDGRLSFAIEVKELFEEAEKLNLLHVEWVDKRIAEKAWSLFVKYHDHKISFTDCTSWSICQQLGIREVFAFDSHFRLLGLEVSP
jgi:hypothetical protein